MSNSAADTALPRCQVRSALDLFHEMGGPEFVDEMIGLLLEQTPIQIRLLHESVASSDVATVKRVAHTMKSSFANFGAQELWQHAQTLELSARGRAVEVLSDHVRQLEAAYARFLERLHSVKCGVV